MLSRMSSEELNGWLAFSRLEPFGIEASFLGHAIVAATIANVNRAKGDKAHRVEEFMPTFGKDEQSIDEMVQFAAIMTAGLGGQDLRE